jgi:3-oxoacyl-[acyl-carrier protein] reductase
VAPLVVWLCTDAAANVNGRTFYVGGEEVGLWSEPELIRSATRRGGWDLDSLDELAANYLTFDLVNNFLLKDSIGDKEL